MSSPFSTATTTNWQDLGGGLRRQVVAYGPELMLVKVAFATGGVGAPHQHPHVQLSYVESGVFEATVGNQTQVLRAGDTFYAPSNVRHGVVCREAGVLLDVFNPLREDFVAAAEQANPQTT